MFIQGGPIRLRQIWWPLQHKSSLMRCPCAFRLGRLAQTGCSGDLSSEGLVYWRGTLVLGAMSIFCGTRGTFGTFWGRKHPKTSFGVTGAGHRTLFHPHGNASKGPKASFCETVVIFDLGHDGCKFWDRSGNPLGNLGLSDRSRRGVVRILRSLAQPPWHFGLVRSLSWRRGAHFGNQGDFEILTRGSF